MGPESAARESGVILNVSLRVTSPRYRLPVTVSTRTSGLGQNVATPLIRIKINKPKIRVKHDKRAPPVSQIMASPCANIEALARSVRPCRLRVGVVGPLAGAVASGVVGETVGAL